jgi:uncharacterized membrane protein
MLFAYDPGDDFQHILNMTYKIGFSLLWAVCSFAIMMLGMRLKIRELRVVSLLVFGCILLKYFLSDFWDLEFLGRTFSMLILGGLLLVIGTSYRRLLQVLEKGELSETETAQEAE